MKARTTITKKSRKYIIFLVIGILATIIAECFGIRNPSAYTLGGLAAKILIRPIIYFIILGLIALAVSNRNVRKHWFPILAWLFLIAGLFDIGMSSFNNFVLRPKLDKNIKELVKSGKLRDSTELSDSSYEGEEK